MGYAPTDLFGMDLSHPVMDSVLDIGSSVQIIGTSNSCFIGSSPNAFYLLRSHI